MHEDELHNIKERLAKLEAQFASDSLGIKVPPSMSVQNQLVEVVMKEIRPVLEQQNKDFCELSQQNLQQSTKLEVSLNKWLQTIEDKINEQEAKLHTELSTRIDTLQAHIDLKQYRSPRSPALKVVENSWPNLHHQSNENLSTGGEIR